ncbi:hypothetical protein vseg_004742 [Gypsophila vaccaria]
MQQQISPSVTSNRPRITQFNGISDIFDSTPYTSSFTDDGSTSVTPVTATSNDHAATATAAAAVAAYSRLMSQHNDLMNRFAFYMSQLKTTFKEAEALRQENTNLRVANRELSHQIGLLLEAAAASFPENEDGGSGGWNETAENKSESPTSVIENDIKQQKDEEGRVGLPKSISVRSNGYLKLNTGGAAGPSGSSSEPKPKPKRGDSAKTRAVSPVSGAHKVYVRGGSKKDGPIELEVYNQGMFKTELCNKWQETGECPYGDHCQFAHGITELRPIIRHPRYKTEVCRMVLAGDQCPYGHRCHFRHALTPDEQLMFPLRHP